MGSSAGSMTICMGGRPLPVLLLVGTAPGFAADMRIDAFPFRTVECGLCCRHWRSDGYARLIWGRAFARNEGVPLPKAGLREQMGFKMIRVGLVLMVLFGVLGGAARAETDAERMKKAADAGDQWAQVTLGEWSQHDFYRFVDGSSVPKDYLASEKWLLMAAAQDNPVALFMLGRLYASGTYDLSDEEPVIKRDELKAVEYYSKFIEIAEEREPQAEVAEKKGLAVMLPKAMSALGDMFFQVCDETPGTRNYEFSATCGREQKGQLIFQNYGQALDWYRRAAKRNDAWAHYRLGRMYELGRAVPQDYGQSLTHYRHAADGGIKDARIALGNLHQKMGDNVSAYMWFNLAVLGDDENEEFVKFRDKALAKLTPQEVEVSQQKAREWYEAHKQ